MSMQRKPDTPTRRHKDDDGGGGKGASSLGEADADDGDAHCFATLERADLDHIATRVHLATRKREAILGGRRVDYSRGSSLQKTLCKELDDDGVVSTMLGMCRSSWVKKSRPIARNAAEARHIMESLMRADPPYMHRAKRTEGNESSVKVLLTPVLQRRGEAPGVATTFIPEERYYVWLYEGSVYRRYMRLIIMFMLAAMCIAFPLWPLWAKKGAFYLSAGFLALTVVFSLVRGLIALIAWIFGYELWIYPHMWNDEIGFVESFSPLILFQKNEASGEERLNRLSAFVAVAAFAYWLSTQPTRFDRYIEAQSSFMNDLYEGNLLTDMSQTDKNNIDKVRPGHIPSLAEILLNSEEGEAEEAATSEGGAGAAEGAVDDGGSVCDDLGEEACTMPHFAAKGCSWDADASACVDLNDTGDVKLEND